MAIAVGVAGGLAACGRQAAAPEPAAEAPPLMARADLFGDPVRQGAQISPSGDRVAFIAPRDGAPNVWVVSVGAMDDPLPVTDNRGAGVRVFWWSQDGGSLLYAVPGANDAIQLFIVPASGGEPRALTPETARAEIVSLGANDPGGAAVALYQRDRRWADLFRIDLATGERTLLYRNALDAEGRGFASLLADNQNRLRLGLKPHGDGAMEYFARDEDGAWRSLFVIRFGDALSSRPLTIEGDGRSFLMLDATDRDLVALVRVDLASGAKTVLGESARADVADVWIDPVTEAPEAFAREYLRNDWRALDAGAQADLDFLSAQLSGDAIVTSRSANDARWIVEESSPTSAPRSYLYDRADLANRRLTPLFRHYPALDAAPLQPMTPVEIAARDGLTLVSYLTLPAGVDGDGDARPDAPVPLVIAPRQGMWGRSSFGFDPLHQWLANRGYAVLSVNSRGSSGFGSAFLNAGNGEWGARMQEDLLDAVQWAIDNGVAQPNRVAIFGAGYGGYAALAGLAYSPDRFRCGVSYGAPSDLRAMVEATPEHEQAYREGIYLRVGDPRTAEGRERLRAHSPSAAAARIERPLLMALGAGDPRVRRADLDAIASDLRARRHALIYVNFPDEGAQLTRAPNRLAFYAIAEEFLGRCLGGRVEPVGAAFEGANLEALEGAVRVPGLSAFVRRDPPRAQIRTLAPLDSGADEAAPPQAPAYGVERPKPPAEAPLN